jgi:putative SOS response-associated peptidase YedK
MCGRFYVPEKDLDDFAGLVNQVEKHLLKKAGEIFPGDYAPVVTAKKEEGTEGQEDVHALKWGFPSSNGKLIINARAETITEKPMFRIPFSSKRCLIPARGFFEWKDAETGKKRIKFFIAPPDQSLIFLAGIYWFFKNGEGTLIPSFTIITTEANQDIKPLHDRMPVIISNESKSIWLHEKQNITAVKQLMQPARQGMLLPVQAD